MKLAEIAALADGLSPVIRDLMAAATKPLADRIVELEAVIEVLKSTDYLDGLRPMILEAAAAEVAKLPPAPPGKEGQPGQPGAPGKLPIVKAWIEGAVHYEADVVTHDGATYQALRDTAKAPPHEDWVCLAARGADGADGRSFAIRGTFDAAAEYSALDVVSLNGASFAAKRDKPGACPGDGWQLIAMQGKRGERGESVKGDPGKAIKGDPGEPVVAIDIDDHGLLTLTNGDGSTVTCDLYPLLSKLDR